MKRVLSIISAGVLVLLAASCVKEDLVVFDASNATAPTLNSFTIGEKEITAEYTPGVFKQGFNDKIAPNHTFAIVSAGGQKFSKAVTTSDKGGVLTLKPVNLAKALMALGFAENSTTDVELAVRATMQDPSKDNGINGFVDSQGRISISGFEVVIPEVVGSPYAEYTEASTWSVIGSLEAYGISWDGDLNMWTDGSNHVAAHITLKAGDEFKFRKDQDWGVNMGGDFGSLDSEFAVSQDGPNIKVGADGTYDLFVNPDAGIAWISAAYDPYPDFKDASNWSVIGSLSIEGISWDGDIAMLTDGNSHMAFGVNIAADDEFKFRQDAAWTVNLGGDFTALDDEFAVSQDGPNIKVGTAGVYDLTVNPGAGTAKVSEASGMKISSIIGGDEPGPEPEPVTGWNIIGLNGDWDNDILATEDNGVWAAYITANEDTEFKWRKDGGWDENYGGVLVALGEPFEAVPGGDNIKVAAGFWKVVLDLTGDVPTITVADGDVWSLIGGFNDWADDVDMVLTDGKWVSPVTKLEGEFKIRHNHGWDENVGGTMEAIGKPFEAVPGGSNINVEAGNYIVTYDPEAQTITVDETGWGLVGTINGWGGTPDIILKEEGLFLVAKNVALTADDEIKLRYKSDWAVNRGARSAVGQAVKAVQDGANIKLGVAGNFDVYYRPDSEVIIILEAGSELTYWGVVGTINSWAAPDRIMYQDESGKYVYDDLETTASDEIKIRQNEDWAVNRGGDFVAFGEPFAVENNGNNVKLGRAAKFSVVYDPEAETITLNGDYTGEAPALPETMYIIGDGVGGWDWAADYIVDMTPVNGKPGQFWAIRYIEAGKGFKFCDVKEWKGDFTGLGEDTGYTVADGNCFVEENGVYMIYVDVENKKLCVEKAKVYGIGDCFGGWDQKMESALFQEADGKLVGKTAAEGEIRIYAESSIATSDWWTREFVFFDGKIAYRGNGGDQERVKVEAGKTVTLDFNAGTAVVE